MPTIELTEEQIRADAQVRDMLKGIAANPKARALLQQAHKLAKPDAVVPELEQQEAVNSAIGELKKTVTDFIEGQTAAQKKAAEDAAQAQAQRRYDDGMAKLRAAGVTEEGLKEVEKIMASEGILNPEIAWNHFEKLHPQPAPILPSGTGSWNFAQLTSDTDADIKSLIDSRGDNAQTLDKMARDALNEVRGGTPRR